MPQSDNMHVSIPDDWDGQTWGIASFCFPDSPRWRAAVRGALYVLGRGRHWDRETGIITAAQAVGVQIEESLAMDCGQYFDRIAVALEQMALFGGCCPSEYTDAPPADIPPLDGDLQEEPGSPPPEGWDTWDEYRANICRYAQGYHEQMLQVLRDIEYYSGLGLVVGGALLAGLLIGIALPWALVAGVASAIALYVSQYSLNELVNEFETCLDDWVCAMYTAETVEGALSALKSAVEGCMAEQAAADLINLMISANWLNLAYSNQLNPADYSQYNPTFCDSCIGEPCENYNLAFGSLIAGDPIDNLGGTFTLLAEPRGGPFTYDTAVIEFDCNIRLELVAYNNWVGGDADSAAVVLNLADEEVYRQPSVNVAPVIGSSWCGNRFSFGSENASPSDFEITLRIINDPC